MKWYSVIATLCTLIVPILANSQPGTSDVVFSNTGSIGDRNDFNVGNAADEGRIFHSHHHPQHYPEASYHRARENERYPSGKNQNERVTFNVDPSASVGTGNVFKVGNVYEGGEPESRPKQDYPYVSSQGQYTQRDQNGRETVFYIPPSTNVGDGNIYNVGNVYTTNKPKVNENHGNFYHIGHGYTTQKPKINGGQDNLHFSVPKSVGDGNVYNVGNVYEPKKPRHYVY